MLRTMLAASLLSVSGFQAGMPMRSPSVAPQRVAAANVQMINLFGNNEESARRRDMLSLRDARAGDRKVTFRKPNTATEGLMLGLKFREQFGSKAVYIDKILPGSEAARLEREGKLKEGDEITMVSATFGDEMWSAKGVGKYRLEKSIAVRQGMTISFVVESPNDGSKKAMNELIKKKQLEEKRISRLQKMMNEEVAQEKKKGGFFDNLFK